PRLPAALNRTTPQAASLNGCHGPHPSGSTESGEARFFRRLPGDGRIDAVLCTRLTGPRNPIVTRGTYAGQCHADRGQPQRARDETGRVQSPDEPVTRLAHDRAEHRDPERAPGLAGGVVDAAGDAGAVGR